MTVATLETPAGTKDGSQTTPDCYSSTKVQESSSFPLNKQWWCYIWSLSTSSFPSKSFLDHNPYALP